MQNFEISVKYGSKCIKCNAQNHIFVILRYFQCFSKTFHKIIDLRNKFYNISYFMKFFQKASKIPQNDKKVILCITFMHFESYIEHFFKFCIHITHVAALITMWRCTRVFNLYYLKAICILIYNYQWLLLFLLYHF